MPEVVQSLVFLGTRKGLFQGSPPPGVAICRDRSEVEAVLNGSPGRLTWVSSTRQWTDLLLEEAVGRRAEVRGSHLITLTPPRPESIPALLGLFHPVFGLVEGFRWLTHKELVEAITSHDASDRFLGGSIDPKAKTLTLLRGDLTAIVASYSLFPTSGDGTAPDFTKLHLADHGRTVSLGDYEASADSILYELDPVYCRRLNKQRRQSDRSFGASLMRLRKQRRLKRSDFAPISSREIARIERNEVEKPHAKTLQTLASRLGVRLETIEDY